ncbi:hypothetical protein F2Q69_00003675 [Brassica cretica]|uniref:Uncharacterized protein n=1 Tax=Brassica cretica TaxID=69181 RepID=A0A8S9NRS9_BRACR|nr:hypothetical protein F2Q69_00003675 [Brassica cretica]
MSRLFLLDRFFHGMWLGKDQGLDLCLFSSSFTSLSKLHPCVSVSICGAASYDCTSSVACGWVGIMVWICACSPPPSLPCPSSIPCVSVSICGAASSDCTSSVACGWVGIMVWICACSPPSSLPCPSSIPSVSVSICGAASSGCTSSTNTHISCSVLSSDCTSSVACGWVGIMVWICACSPPSSLPCPSSIPSVSCAPPVSTHVRITSPPSRPDSTTVSNGDKSAAENQTSENEKQDDGPDKTEVQDSSKLSHSDSTALANDAENTSSEAKKGGKDPSAADNSREKDSSDNAAWS